MRGALTSASGANAWEKEMTDRQRWRPALFDCPRTGQKVQGLFAEESFNMGEPRYEPVSCLACSGIHFIDPVRGKLLGAKGSE
jgi:hypothetical protein